MEDAHLQFFNVISSASSICKTSPPAALRQNVELLKPKLFTKFTKDAELHAVHVRCVEEARISAQPGGSEEGELSDPYLSGVLVLLHASHQKPLLLWVGPF